MTRLIAAAALTAAVVAPAAAWARPALPPELREPDCRMVVESRIGDCGLEDMPVVRIR